MREILSGKKAITKRDVLSFLMSAYDPLGLICPVLIHGKLLLRRLYGPKAVGWDSDLPKEEQRLWGRWMEELSKEDGTKHPRSVHPRDSTGQPILVGFADASLDAICACLYTVWPVKGPEKVRVNLLIAKSRVNPIHGTSVPRAELQALVVLLRLTKTVVKAVDFKFEEVVLASDSECVLAALEKHGASMLPFFSNRVAEIHATLKDIGEICPNTGQILHVPGIYNPSDIGTRSNVRMKDIDKESRWQKGPSFLCEPRKGWPLKLKNEGEIPDVEKKKRYIVSAMATTTNCFKTMSQAKEMIKNSGSLSTAVGGMARILKAAWKEERAQIKEEPSQEERRVAKKILIWASSSTAVQALEKGDLSSLGAKLRGGIVWVSGRIRKEEMAKILGVEELPVVISSEPLAQMILQEAHREDHSRDPQSVVARARRLCWIPRGTVGARKVIKGCMKCRRQDAVMMNQVMGDLPPEKLTASAPFQVCAVDLFGPFKVKDVSSSRRTFKCWGALYVCLSTKAVAIFGCPGYSTEVFLDTHRKFEAIYTPGSHPARVYCDHGTQLIAAAEQINWEEVQSKEGGAKTEWVLTPKGCSWRNGSCERGIRAAKHSLQNILQTGCRLDFHQLDCTFHQIAAILNTRPLSVRRANEDRFYSICPADVLLGRAAQAQTYPDQLRMEDDEEEGLERAFSHQKQVVDAWWKEWTVQCFPDLLVRNKWKKECRNTQVGDVCQLSYKAKYGPASFKLCRVVEVHPDEGGVVRTVEVALWRKDGREDGRSVYSPKPLQVMTVGVQRLAMMVPVEEQVQE